MTGKSTVVSTKQNRKIAIAIIVGATFILGSVLAFLPARAIEEQRLTAISQNCSTIKQTLGQLQRADSRTRTYLGAAYETISSKFITPLSLRLTRNNHEAEELFSIQANFSAEQERFRAAYTDYMRELEGLIATDCSAHPEDFYKHLESTRQKRAALKLTTAKLSELANAQYAAVLKLEESL